MSTWRMAAFGEMRFSATGRTIQTPATLRDETVVRLPLECGENEIFTASQRGGEGSNVALRGRGPILRRHGFRPDDACEAKV